MSHHSQLSIKAEPQVLAPLSTLFQSGIQVTIDNDVALTDLLLSLPGFTLSYLGDAVQTIFVNGVPLDDMQQPVQPGTTIALSAAMPGLAGAIFRKQGLHGSMRSKPVALTKTSTATHTVRIKLFNSIATDRAQDLFTHGVVVDAKAMLSVLERRPDMFSHADLELDSQGPVSLTQLKDHLSTAQSVRLHVLVQPAKA